MTAAFDQAARALRPGGAPPGATRLDLVVDGARVTLEAVEDRVQLSCAIAAQPADEGARRALMASFFRHADRGAEVLAATPDGSIMLVAKLAPGDDIPALVQRFCDAAAHWGAASPAARVAPVRPPFGPVIIMP